MSDYKLKFTKLDKRFRGHNQFSHYVQVVPNQTNGWGRSSYVQFMALRQSCVEAWGMSCERELYLKIAHEKTNEMLLNNHWAWHSDINNGQYRIYLKSDAERAWLLLKW